MAFNDALTTRQSSLPAPRHYSPAPHNWLLTGGALIVYVYLIKGKDTTLQPRQGLAIFDSTVKRDSLIIIRVSSCWLLSSF
jgi:hypothetical protein